ncbi:hypothetical protein RD792_001111 [Penstemon davidsonii]|uniref:Uncharacterized protein n=1 Tax=Penstemon davidsonii TaxID=160366 RepID=A0ABR0DMH5_9LAMI|nr:hypothetical protein RD792_001111 [Penstemon davidsonii]
MKKLMVSEATDVLQEQHFITESDPSLPLNEQFPEDAFSPKMRKPYTISKQRERWTEEEHNKFLEALKLYGRAWRKIEEHVGTKTAVQIRSHAQKFFSKVVRESNTDDSTSTKPIEIPPPRPKRKPMHPYPRKLVSPVKNGISMNEEPTRSQSPKLYISEQENQSPTSVFSAIGSDASGGADTYSPDGSPSPASSGENSSSDEQVPVKLKLLPRKNALPEEDSKESFGSCLKLFGKTLLVKNPQKPNHSVLDQCKSEPMDKIEESRLFVPLSCKEGKNQSTSDNNCSDPLPWLTLWGGASLSTLEVHNPTPIKARHLSYNEQEKLDKDEGSLTGSNSASTDGEKNGKVVKSSFSSYKLSKIISANLVDCRKGFVPYKRCLVVENGSDISSTETGQEREKQRTRFRL